MSRDIYNLDRYKPNKTKNLIAFRHWLVRLITLKTTLFKWNDFPDEINVRYMEWCLLIYGKVAVFKDDVLNKILILPFTVSGMFDLYGEPKQITVFSTYSSYTASLEEGSFVIIYDNYMRQSCISDLTMYSDLLADIQSTIGMQIAVHKTPYVITGQNGVMKTAEKVLQEVIENKVTINVDANFDMKDGIKVLQLVPPQSYIGNDLLETRNELWKQALNFLGIESVTNNKKERLLTGEVNTANSEAISQRLSYWKPRLEACEKINKMFSLNVTVEINKDIMDERGVEYADYGLSSSKGSISNKDAVVHDGISKVD